MAALQLEAIGEPLIGVREAARLLGMSRVTVTRMAHAGQLPTIAFPKPRGKHLYKFRNSELEAYLSTLRRPLQEKAL
jgi:excisionase family DNA binding protein